MSEQQLTTEEELKELMLDDEAEDNRPETVNRFVDLLIDLIAERSEEKAEEVLENHEIKFDHYGI